MRMDMGMDTDMGEARTGFDQITLGRARGRGRAWVGGRAQLGARVGSGRGAAIWKMDGGSRLSSSFSLDETLLGRCGRLAFHERLLLGAVIIHLSSLV